MLKYGKYTLVSRPRRNRKVRVWHPCARVFWYDDDDLVHSHRFKLKQTFDSEEDALLFGLLIARMWIDVKKRPHRSLSFANRSWSKPGRRVFGLVLASIISNADTAALVLGQ